MTQLRATYPYWFLPAVLILVTLEWWVIQQPAFATPNGNTLALAVTLDLVLGIPLLGYLFLVRPRKAPPLIVAPLFLLAVILANWLLPASQQTYLDGIELILPFLELALLIFAIIRIRRIVQTYRAVRPTTIYGLDALRLSLQKGFGPTPVVEILMTELSLVFFALTGWFMRFTSPLPHQSFSYHSRTGYSTTFGLLIGLTLIELPLMHLIIQNFSITAAWVLTILSAYTLLWLIGDFHAMRLQPIVIVDGTLYLRCGLRWRTDLPLSAIRTVRKATAKERDGKGLLSFSPMGDARLVLELDAPIIIHGLFGIRRETDTLGLHVDDEARLVAALPGAHGVANPMLKA